MSYKIVEAMGPRQDATVTGHEGTPEWSVIPEPSVIETGRGAVTMTACGVVAESRGVGDLGFVYARQLADDIGRVSGGRWTVTSVNGAGDVVLDVDPSLDEWSYVLEVSRNSVVITGADRDGVRDGVQTLRQIVRQTGPTIPCVTVRDRPAFRTRGYYLDVTRGRVPTMDWLESWVDRLCLYKYNQFQLYIEHAFRFDSLSEMWRGSDPLTPSDILELDSYCAARGIELVPSVSTFGHHYTALRTKSLRDLGEFPEDADRPFSLIERMKHHTLNITDERSYAFSTSLIDGLMPLFRSDSFNICADETFDLGKGRSKQEAEQHGIGAMYADFVGRLCRHITDKGHGVMMWADVALEHPEIIDELPGDVIWLNWQYEPDADDSKVAALAHAGARQMVCPAVWCWNALLPRIDDAWNNISRMARHGMAHGASGMLVTDWGDFGHVNDPRMSIPGMAIGAQQAWNPEAGIDERGMLSRISRIEYGDPSGELVGVLGRASSDTCFSWGDLVAYIELDDGRGGCNMEVVRAADSLKPYRVRLSQSGRPALGEARGSMLETMRGRLAGYRIANVDLDRCAARLAQLFRASDSSSAAAVCALAIDGQRLLNEVGPALASKHGIMEINDGRDPVELADDLERWTERYSETWREVSRQSELSRIQHVLWKTADVLRS